MNFFWNKKLNKFNESLPEIISLLENGELQTIEKLLWQPAYTKIEYLPIVFDMVQKFKKPFSANQNLEIHKTIDKGNLAIISGHLQTETDKILRQHILNIMCRMETSWEDPSNQTHTMYETIERLREMELDGIINMNYNSFKITETGKPFVRNICMAFDERLNQQTNEKPLFSKVI